MTIQIDNKLKETLVQADCEWLTKDLWNMLKECRMQDGTYKIRLRIIEGDFGSNTAHLFVIDNDKVVLSKTYNFSKLSNPLELTYSNRTLS